jgi:hypothetical protein
MSCRAADSRQEIKTTGAATSAQADLNGPLARPQTCEPHSRAAEARIKERKAIGTATPTQAQLNGPWACPQTCKPRLGTAGICAKTPDVALWRAGSVRGVLENIWPDGPKFEMGRMGFLTGSLGRPPRYTRCLSARNVAERCPQYQSEKALVALMAANGGHGTATGCVASQMELAADALVWEVDRAFHALQADEGLTPMGSLRGSQSQTDAS